MCKRTRVLALCFGCGLMSAIMAQEAPAEQVEAAAPSEANQLEEGNASAPEVVMPAEQVASPSAEVVRTAEVLPVITPETKPENAPEQKTDEKPAEQAPVAESKSEVPAAVAPVSDAKTSSEPAVDEPSAKKQKTDAGENKVEEMVGIDTINVDEPAGNWLYKRLYWERAEDKYQKIKELMAVVFDARSKFFDQRVKLDKDIFDPLYTLASFRRGELSGILKELLDDIEKQKQQKNELDDSARVLFAKVEANKERLEEVKKEIEFVGKIDNAVDEAINTLISLLNQGRNFEMQAWGDFKAISRELSDKKARDLFYRIDTYWRNIKDIEVYVTTKLTEHMNYLASSAQQHADIVKGLLKELEAEGFVLKEQVDALERSKAGVQGADQDEVVVKAKAKSSGFFASAGTFFSGIVKPFVAIAKALWHTITIPFRYFFGDKKPAQSESVPAVPEVVLEGASAQKQALPEVP